MLGLIGDIGSSVGSTIMSASGLLEGAGAKAAGAGTPNPSTVGGQTSPYSLPNTPNLFRHLTCHS